MAFDLVLDYLWLRPFIAHESTFMIPVRLAAIASTLRVIVLIVDVANRGFASVGEVDMS